MTTKRQLLDRLLELAEKLEPARLESLIMMLDKEVLSVSEVAGIMGVHQETVRRAIRAGRLRAFRIGGDKRAAFHVTAEELQRFMTAPEPIPTGETGG